MTDYAYETVGVFTSAQFGGNPLAVFPDARGLSDAQMQAIAREFNLSETSFVFPPEDPRHTAQVRIFTPANEVPFAGHPNVGTGFVLARRATAPLPEHFVFEEKAGLVRVHIQRDAAGVPSGARIAAPQSLQVRDDVPVADIAALAGLPESAIDTTDHTPLVASVGTNFVIARLTSLENLAKAVPDLSAFRRLVAARPAWEGRLSLHLYALRDGSATQLRSRMFAPLAGIPEDPATGSANAALAGLLTSLAPGDDVEMGFEIEQGIEMGRPSLILATARKAAEGPVSVSIAGDCVPMMKGVLSI